MVLRNTPSNETIRVSPVKNAGRIVKPSSPSWHSAVIGPRRAQQGIYCWAQSAQANSEQIDIRHYQ